MSDTDACTRYGGNAAPRHVDDTIAYVKTFVNQRTNSHAPRYEILESYIDSLTSGPDDTPIPFEFSAEDLALGDYVPPESSHYQIAAMFPAGAIQPDPVEIGEAPDIEAPEFEVELAEEVFADNADAFEPDEAVVGPDAKPIETRTLDAPEKHTYTPSAYSRARFQTFDVGTVDTTGAPTFDHLTVAPTGVTVPTPGAAPLPVAVRDFALERVDERPADPARPNLATIGGPALGTAPTWTEPAPTFDFDGAPGASPANWVGHAPALAPVVLPTYRGPADPPEPALLTVPTVTIRDPDLPVLSIDSPLLGNLPTLEGTVFYVDPDYADAQLAQLQTEIGRVLSGDLGIPDYLWDAIWDKAGTQLHRQAVALERQSRRAWAKLGWMLPGGTALAGREQAAHDLNEQLSEKARELAIQRATMEREDFWQAVQHGTALQQLLIGLYNSQQERALKLALGQVEVAVNVYNAHLARYTAQVQATQSQVAIADLRLKSALAVLEVDKTKLEGAKLVGEINQLAVQAYVAKWEGVKSAIEKYKAELGGTEVRLKADELKVRIFGEEVKAWMAEIDAWGKEWDGYVAKLKAQETKGNVYESAARVFSERMKGYAISADVEKTRIDATVTGETLKLEQYKADLQKFQTDWGAINAKLQTAAAVYGTEAQIYGTRTELEKARSQMALENEKLTLQAAELDLQRFKTEWDAQTALLGAAAQAFGARVQGYAARIDGEAKAMSARAQAAGVSVQGYAAQAEEYKADVQKALGAIDAEVRYYTASVQHRGNEAQLKSAQTQADAAVFGSRIQLEGVKAQALGAKAQYLAALVDAQVRYYAAQVEKFSADVQFEKVAVEGYAAEAQAKATVHNADVEGFKALIQKYAAEVQGEAAALQAQAQRYQSEAALAESRFKVGSLGADIYTRVGQVQAQLATANAQIASAKTLAVAEVKAKGYEALASFDAQLAAGAMAAMNVSATISSGFSLSQGSSCTTTHTYDHSGE